MSLRNSTKASEFTFCFKNAKMGLLKAAHDSDGSILSFSQSKVNTDTDSEHYYLATTLKDISGIQNSNLMAEDALELVLNSISADGIQLIEEIFADQFPLFHLLMEGDSHFSGEIKDLESDTPYLHFTINNNGLNNYLFFVDIYNFWM